MQFILCLAAQRLCYGQSANQPVELSGKLVTKSRVRPGAPLCMSEKFFNFLQVLESCEGKVPARQKATHHGLTHSH